MGFIDKMKGKDYDMSEIRARFNELRDQEMQGQLDDKGREELKELRRHLIKEQ